MKNNIHTIRRNLNNIKVLMNKLNTYKLSPKCFLNDCDDKPIKSHSISKEITLNKIVERDGKNGVVVYTIDDDNFIDWEDGYSTTYQNKKKNLRSIGISEASVFKGFCKIHDNKIFEEIDNSSYENNDKIFFLHSIRTRCYIVSKMKETFKVVKDKLIPELKNIRFEEIVSMLEVAIKSLDITLSIIPKGELITFEHAQLLITEFESLNSQVVIDRVSMTEDLKKQFEKILTPSNFPMPIDEFKPQIISCLETKILDAHLPENFEYYLHLIKNLDIHNLKAKEKFLTETIKKMDHSKFEYYHRTIPKKYLIAGGFEFSFKGYDYTVTFFPENDHTVFVFSNMKGENSFFYNQLNIMSDKEFLQKISQLVIQFGQNTYFAPSVWNTYDKKIKNCILNRQIQDHFNLFK